jgi:hypothetical protein
MWTAVGLVGFAALMRLVPHPWNFTPVGAMALFGGAVLGRAAFAFGVPLAAMALSDVALNLLAWLTGGPAMTPSPWTYAAFVLIGAIGFALRGRRSLGMLAGASIGGSVLFFAVTNFGVWMAGFGYPPTLAGLAACFTAAIPFFANTLLGDLFWNAVLFGSAYALGRAVLPRTAHS